VPNRQFQQFDPETRLLEFFRSMSDDCQFDALSIMESLAETSPRRPALSLRLLAGGAPGVLGHAPRGRQ
jgi:hypothetical protein